MNPMLIKHSIIQLTDAQSFLDTEPTGFPDMKEYDFMVMKHWHDSI